MSSMNHSDLRGQHEPAMTTPSNRETRASSPGSSPVRTTSYSALRPRHCAALLMLACLSVGGCGPIWIWNPGFAQRIAKQENAPILYYFKAWDSTAHRNMMLDVFEHPPTKKEMMDTVNVELEFAWFPDEAKRCGVQRAQVCVVCSPDGEIIDRLYVNPIPSKDAFLTWLQEAKAKALPEPTSAPAETQPAITEDPSPATPPVALQSPGRPPG